MVVDIYVLTNEKMHLFIGPGSSRRGPSINSVPETKIADFANSVDLDEVAHHEPPHQDLYCLSSSL